MGNSKKENFKNRERYRGLFETEVALARTVYKDTIPYERIFIANYKTHTQGITLATRRNKKKANYIFLWSNVFETDVTSKHNLSSTFIHELCHVWQSQHSKKSAISYMRESAWKQIQYGVKDIFKESYSKGFGRIGEMIKKGFVKEWDYHRGRAYAFDISEIGKDFKEFNVEQQALIIETWFRKEPYITRNANYPAGFASEDDLRFPYIRDCLWKRDPNAKYSSY